MHSFCSPHLSCSQNQPELVKAVMRLRTFLGIFCCVSVVSSCLWESLYAAEGNIFTQQTKHKTNLNKTNVTDYFPHLNPVFFLTSEKTTQSSDILQVKYEFLHQTYFSSFSEP